ncbi:hypothetical protein MMPV_004574 [Pyropia vietnamensis]
MEADLWARGGFAPTWLIERLSFGVDGLRSWRFTPGVTALSSAAWPAITIVIYVGALVWGQRFMMPRKPPQLRRLLVVHNAVCAAVSGVLFVSLAWVLAAKAPTTSLHQLVCSRASHEDGRLQLIYYLNYLMKYWELGDTALLVIRKRRVTFLHSFHHAATLALAYIHLVEHSAVQWVPILLNVGVHVLMYSYYAMAAAGARPGVAVKSSLTGVQIAQFVIGVSAACYGFATYVAGGWDTGACWGTQFGAASGIGVLGLYLVLFVRFYRQTYLQAGRAPREKKME